MGGGGGENTFKLERVGESLKEGSKCKVRMKNVPVLALKQSTGSFKKGINFFWRRGGMNFIVAGCCYPSLMSIQ